MTAPLQDEGCGGQIGVRLWVPPSWRAVRSRQQSLVHLVRLLSLLGKAAAGRASHRRAAETGDIHESVRRASLSARPARPALEREQIGNAEPYRRNERKHDPAP